MRCQFSVRVVSVLAVRFLAVEASPWWEQVLQRISPPVFRNAQYNIEAYDAKADGKTDSREAIKQAIADCSREGGGRVVVPGPGTYYVAGPIHLKANVDLHIASGATLKFSPVSSDYVKEGLTLTHFEGTELFNYSPLIYGYQLTNVALTGGGVLDGSGQAGFAKYLHKQGPDQERIRSMGNDSVPVSSVSSRVFGPGHYLRPCFVQFLGCKNVLVEGVTLIDSPFWTLHPVLSSNVIVRGVIVDSPHVNNDACDPESSVDVLIENNVFVTGDDCISIKSGRDADAWRVGQPSENIIIRNNTCRTNGSNGVCVGSEMSGGVRRVFVDGGYHVFHAGNAIGFKSNLDRGAYIEDVYIRGVTVDTVLDSCISFTNNYHGARGGHVPTRFHNITIEGSWCKSAQGAGINIEGLPDMPISDVTLVDVVVDSATVPTNISHVQHLVFRNVTVNGRHVDPPGFEMKLSSAGELSRSAASLLV